MALAGSRGADGKLQQGLINMLKDLELLRRAARSSRGFSVWVYGDAYIQACELQQRGWLRSGVHEWGKDWLRFKLTEEGEKQIQA